MFFGHVYVKLEVKKFVSAKKMNNLKSKQSISPFLEAATGAQIVKIY